MNRFFGLVPGLLLIGGYPSFAEDNFTLTPPRSHSSVDQQLVALSAVHPILKQNIQPENFTPTGWGDGGWGACGGYCNGIGPGGQGDCPSNRRPCYGNPSDSSEAGHCMCCYDNYCSMRKR